MAEKIRRADFSDALVHLTRERREYSSTDFLKQELLREVSAFDVLKEIMSSGIIRGSGNEGYVKGTRRAVCFSEIPLAAMHLFARPPDDPFEPATKARYRFYGIAISKRALFEAGGRPVIYLPDSEGHWIPPEEKWRQVRYEHGRVDFTHEREWRAPGDLDLKTLSSGIYVIVWSATEARELANFSSPLVAGRVLWIIPMEHMVGMV
jgi:hypothetical protein